MAIVRGLHNVIFEDRPRGRILMGAGAVSGCLRAHGPGVRQTDSPEYRKIGNRVTCQNIFPNVRYIHGGGTTSETSRQHRLATDGGSKAWQPRAMRR